MSSRFRVFVPIALTFGASLVLAGCGGGAAPTALPASATAVSVASTQATAGGANAAVCQTVEADYATFLAGYSKHPYQDFANFSDALGKIPDTENALSTTQLGADIGALGGDAYELYNGSNADPGGTFNSAALAQFDSDTNAVANDCGTTFKLPPAY